MQPSPFHKPMYLQLPSNQNLTLEELGQAWKFLDELHNQPFLPVLPPNLKRLSPEDWEAVGYLLHRELENRRRHRVN